MLSKLLIICLSLVMYSQSVLAETEPTDLKLEAYLELATQKNLAAHPTWAALLHVSEAKANIRSDSFLLSHADFSLANELRATLRLLYVDQSNQVCRFPARYMWLRQELDLPALPIQNCAELQEFKARAPMQEIALAFASENLAQPSSMMGHVFLKLSGVDERGQNLEHAISFFTDAGGINIPKLFFDSMVIGKKGYFSLSPYQEKISLYLGEEQRSIWEYTLRLNQQQKDLIQAHLIELRQTDLVYFFQKYNCATVIDFILAIAASRTLDTNGFWLTPKDVVKRAHELDLIDSSRMMSPNRWLIRAVGEQFTSQERALIAQQVERQAVPSLTELDTNKTYLTLQLARAYQAYRNESTKEQSASAIAYVRNLEAIVKRDFPQHQLQVLDSKNPLETPQDSQVSIGFVRQDRESYARVTMTPTSHHLEDDNRHYFSETELLLFELSLLKNLRTRQLLIDKLTVYAAQSFIPFDSMSGGISGAIRMGIKPQFDAKFQAKKAAYLEGALGFTHRSGTDIDSFALLGLGMAWRNGQSQVYLQPEIGVIAREIFDMKSRVSVVLTSNIHGDHARNLHYRFVQSKYFQKESLSIHLSIDRFQQQKKRQNSYELSLKKMF
jgi:hypothetical protein